MSAVGSPTAAPAAAATNSAAAVALRHASFLTQQLGDTSSFPPPALARIVDAALSAASPEALLRPAEIVVAFDFDGTISIKNSAFDSTRMSDPRFRRTVLRGGEPFAALLRRLQARGVHLVVVTAAKASGLPSIQLQLRDYGLEDVFRMGSVELQSARDVPCVGHTEDGEKLLRCGNVLTGSDGYNKAVYLASYIQAERISPRLVVFLDDGAVNVVSVREHYLQMQPLVAFFGFHVPQVENPSHAPLLALLRGDQSALAAALALRELEPNEVESALAIRADASFREDQALSLDALFLPVTPSSAPIVPAPSASAQTMFEDGLALVSSYLPLRDNQAMQRCCRAWKAVVERATAPSLTAEFDSASTMAAFISSCPFALRKRLTRLRLTKHSITPAQLAAIKIANPQLTDLTVRLLGDASFHLQAFPPAALWPGALTHLTLFIDSSNASIVYSVLGSLSRASTHVRKLRLDIKESAGASGNISAKQEGARSLARMPALEELVCPTWAWELITKQMSVFREEGSPLRELAWPTWSLSDEQLTAYAQFLPCTSTLAPFQWSAENTQLFASLPHLNTVRFGHVKVEAIPSLCLLRSLSTLTFHDFELAHFSALVDVAPRLPLLSTVHFEFIDQYRQGGVLTFAALPPRLPRLTALRLDYIELLELDDFIAALENAPVLRTISIAHCFRQGAHLHREVCKRITQACARYLRLAQTLDMTIVGRENCYNSGAQCAVGAVHVEFPPFGSREILEADDPVEEEEVEDEEDDEEDDSDGGSEADEATSTASEDTNVVAQADESSLPAADVHAQLPPPPSATPPIATAPLTAVQPTSQLTPIAVAAAPAQRLFRDGLALTLSLLILKEQAAAVRVCRAWAAVRIPGEPQAGSQLTLTSAAQFMEFVSRPATPYSLRHLLCTLHLDTSGIRLADLRQSKLRSSDLSQLATCVPQLKRWDLGYSLAIEADSALIVWPASLIELRITKELDLESLAHVIRSLTTAASLRTFHCVWPSDSDKDALQPVLNALTRSALTKLFLERDSNYPLPSELIRTLAAMKYLEELGISRHDKFSFYFHGSLEAFSQQSKLQHIHLESHDLQQDLFEQLSVHLGHSLTTLEPEVFSLLDASSLLRFTKLRRLCISDQSRPANLARVLASITPTLEYLKLVGMHWTDVWLYAAVFARQPHLIELRLFEVSADALIALPYAIRLRSLSLFDVDFDGPQFLATLTALATLYHLHVDCEVESNTFFEDLVVTCEMKMPSMRSLEYSHRSRRFVLFHPAQPANAFQPAVPRRTVHLTDMPSVWPPLDDITPLQELSSAVPLPPCPPASPPVVAASANPVSSAQNMFRDGVALVLACLTLAEQSAAVRLCHSWSSVRQSGEPHPSFEYTLSTRAQFLGFVSRPLSTAPYALQHRIHTNRLY